MKDLSEGTAVPISYAPVQTLMRWDRGNLDELKTEDLEELGRAWFEGVEDELEPNHSRAYEVWSVAAQRGSVEAQYSMAVCLRQGSGVPQDSSAAFKTLEKLANSHNYGLAHVSQ